jgi:hypothetical protein
MENNPLKALERGEVGLPPLLFSEIRKAASAGREQASPDALLSVRWGKRAYRFAAVFRKQWTPRAIREAAEAAQRTAPPLGRHPLVLVPYLSEDQLAELEAREVSGIDLCGNGLVLVPGELLVRRTGSPNRFRGEGAIKNVYRKDSSMAARLFLLVPEFGSVQGALRELQQRGGQLTLATVSKVCKALEDDLIIERGRGEARATRQLRLLQPEKLLDLLAANYTPPEITRRFTGKCTLGPESLEQHLSRWEERTGGRIAQTGSSSVDRYAVMAREPVRAFYCSDVGSLVRTLGESVRETDRFANLALEETEDGFAYFDRRKGLAASPIQTYLELFSGEKRERETAEQVRRVILGALERSPREE